MVLGCRLPHLRRVLRAKMVGGPPTRHSPPAWHLLVILLHLMGALRVLRQGLERLHQGRARRFDDYAVERRRVLLC